MIKLWLQKLMKALTDIFKKTPDKEIKLLPENEEKDLNKTLKDFVKPSPIENFIISDNFYFPDKEESNPVIITIDGKTYNSTNQEEIAEILKYLGEQLRAKK